MSDEQAASLASWTRTMTTPQGMVTRVRSVLALADGDMPIAVAHAQRLAPTTVHERRNHFLAADTQGLGDWARPVARAGSTTPLCIMY